VLRAIPGITLLPLLVLVLGIQFDLKLTLVGIACFWPLLVQTIYGVQDVDPVAKDMARAYGIGRTRTFFEVILPSTVPYIVTGLRLSAIIALNVAIGAELLVGGTGGIGDRMGKLSLVGAVPQMFVYVVAAAILGLLIRFGLGAAEKRVLHWHPSQRETVAQ
jgi:ABC-type nitrate/sulfonate/bicarbonate transport system permease component